MPHINTQHLISTLELKRPDVEQLLSKASVFAEMLDRGETSDALEGCIVGILFHEPSTRTRLSFETAILRLGGSFTGYADAELSRAGSTWKESLSDTARTLNGGLSGILCGGPVSSVEEPLAKDDGEL
ncbi:aspartate carbamoyltransferase [Sinorhizobium meliloti]|nr:hypothetical protein [Sinorhizobium meliloti]ASP87123.1 hypothetical protein CDO26_21720 [Sinorhizobium meliloti]RVJ60296.1 hypothetical protein CN171_36015 [Sinorhizobium meliloti]